MIYVSHEFNDMELTKKELMLIAFLQLILIGYGYYYSGTETSIP